MKSFRQLNDDNSCALSEDMLRRLADADGTASMCGSSAVGGLVVVSFSFLDPRIFTRKFGTSPVQLSSTPYLQN